jgi:DNA polymerase-3 subunit epsilon
MKEPKKQTTEQMLTALLLDTETTGLDPKVDHVIEAAAVTYSLQHACVLHAFSAIVRVEQSADVEKINRIPSSAAMMYGADWPWVMERLKGYATNVDVVVAHNKEFDYGFVGDLCGKPWVCSAYDLDWPGLRKDSTLVGLAIENGVPVSDAHRALSDCLTMARLLTRVAEKVNLSEFFEEGLRPKPTYIALAPFSEKDTVKAHGFRWNPDRKQWRRRMKPEDAAQLPFAVRQMEE